MCTTISRPEAAGLNIVTGNFYKILWIDLPAREMIDLEPRLDYRKVAPGVRDAMMSLGKYLSTSSLEKSLLNLIDIRASQINGCAWCLDMHSKDASSAGETDQRIYMLPAWRESPFYTDRERAALEWTEAVSLVADSHVPDDAYKEARKHFSEKELVDLTLAIVTINGWNRLNVAFRTVPGSYKPHQYETKQIAT